MSQKIKTHPLTTLAIKVGDRIYSKTFEWDMLPSEGEHIDFTFDCDTAPRILVGGRVQHIENSVSFSAGTGDVYRTVVCTVGSNLDPERVAETLSRQGFTRIW